MTQTAELSIESQEIPAPAGESLTSAEVALPELPLTGTVHPPIPADACARVEISQLSVHPDYRRENDALDPEFKASIANNGATSPILIVPNTDAPGAFWVLDGVLRMRAAVLAGRGDLPYYRDPEIDHDRAKQNLRALQLNTERMVKAKTAYDQMEIIGLAVEHGASMTSVRKTLGLKVQSAKELVAAAKVLRNPSVELKEALGKFSQDSDSGFEQGSMEDLIALTKFNGDAEALRTFEEYQATGEPVAFAVEMVKQDLEKKAKLAKAAAEADQTIADFTASGGELVTTIPQSALSLSELRVVSDEEGSRELTPEDHQDCPGRAIHVTDDHRGLPRVTHLCLDPYAHKHAFASSHNEAKHKLRHELVQAGRTVTMRVPLDATRLDSIHLDGQPITPEQHASCPGSAVGIEGFWGDLEVVEFCADAKTHDHTIVSKSSTTRSSLGDEPSMKLRKNGRSAWKASAGPRRAFLKSYLTGKTGLTREVSAFLFATLFRMPATVSEAFNDSVTAALFKEITGTSTAKAATKVASDTATDGRRQVYLFAKLAALMERQIEGDDIRDYTWRNDGHKANSHCQRELAGAYLNILRGEGHQLSSIERAVADGNAYLGDGVTKSGDGDLLTNSTGGVPDSETEAKTETSADGPDATDPAAPDQESGTPIGTGEEVEPDPGESDPPADSPDEPEPGDERETPHGSEDDIVPESVETHLAQVA